MLQAIVDRARGVVSRIRPVHRLQRESLEGEAREVLGPGIRLRIDQLEFVTFGDAQIRAGLRTDAKPVDAIRRRDGAIGLDADLETAGMQGVDECLVHLQQRLPSVSTT